jgi:hypothetical protein
VLPLLLIVRGWPHGNTGHLARFSALVARHRIPIGLDGPRSGLKYWARAGRLNTPKDLSNAWRMRKGSIWRGSYLLRGSFGLSGLLPTRSG